MHHEWETGLIEASGTCSQAEGSVHSLLAREFWVAPSLPRAFLGRSLHSLALFETLTFSGPDNCIQRYFQELMCFGALRTGLLERSGDLAWSHRAGLKS